MKSVSNKYAIISLTIIILSSIFGVIYLKETYIVYPLTSNNVIVIKPIFTSTAYTENGFYDYFKNECGKECLTVKINDTLRFSSSKNAIDIFAYNNFKIITDIELDKDPIILSHYKTVIILHNEYVTQKEFDAITTHPNVIYLYPNALYGKVSYSEDKITLERGHGYPDSAIGNGFDWKFDNTHPYEYDTYCKNWEFYKIDNGIMLNCYPEHIIKRNIGILSELAKLIA